MSHKYSKVNEYWRRTSSHLDLNSSSEEETGFDCLQENSDTEENMAPTRCDENAHAADTEPLLSSDLRWRLKDRLRKRFNEEDLDYFHDDSRCTWS